MKNNTFLLVLALIFATGLSMYAIEAWRGSVSENDLARISTDADMPLAADFVSLQPEVGNLPAESISDAERAGLLFMREEEKLARDVYHALGDAWQLAIFDNIAQSEQTHTEAVRSLLVKYDIPDPVAQDVAGEFVNADLQRLYDELVLRGSQSAEEALTVGALIEDIDLADLEMQLAATDNADIALVYGNLARGSRNHLRAFTKQLGARGVMYSPVKIKRETFDAIIASDRETGGGVGKRGKR